MNRFFLLLTITLLGHLVQAQVDLRDRGPQKPTQFPDTLILDTEAQIALTFAFHKIGDKRDYMSNELWSGILGIMKTAVESSEYLDRIHVSYQKVEQGEEEVARIEVSPLATPSDVYIIGQDGITEKPADRIEFTVRLTHLVISFYLMDLKQIEELMEMNIESIWDQIEMKYDESGKRKVYEGSGMVKYGNANIDKIDSKLLSKDAVELSMGVGMGFYRDRFIPDLGFLLAFKFQDRYGEPKMQTGLLYTQQYIFEGGSEIATSEPDVNGFLTGFFKIRYNRGADLGVGLGYLIHGEGGFYEGDTFKFSLFSESEDSRFSFTPELIFTNNFNQAFPALRIGLSF